MSDWWIGDEKSKQQYILELEQQLAELREALSDAAYGFEGAAAGHGVNFFAYAQDIRALLKQLAELKCDMVKRERYHKAQLAELREAAREVHHISDRLRRAWYKLEALLQEEDDE